MDHETIATDVLLVGAGPASLACAIHLAKLLAAAGRPREILVIEKATEVGQHILSGAVMDPRGLDELFAGRWREEGCPVEAPVASESVYYLTATGKQAQHAPPPLVILDAGNDPSALAHELAGEHVQVLTRLSGKRVFYTDPGDRPPGQRGAPRRHGQKLSLSDPASGPAPDMDITAQSPRYGTVRVRAWRGMHQELGRSGHWADWPPHTELPIVRGTVIQINVEHPPGGRKPLKHLWLFHCAPTQTEPDIDLLWKAYLRRFDQEHFHRFAKVHLGLRAAHLASAAATDRWAQLAMVAYAQLRMASTLTEDLRRPWQPKQAPGTVSSPYRTRLGFRRLRAKLGTPTKPAKFSRPGPGRPKGSKNRPKATRPPHRKSVKTDISYPQRP